MGPAIEVRSSLIFGVFFASGAAGLIYQVVWSRLLTLVIGVSIFAITAVICTFMMGLALGSYLIGRRADHWRHPLRVYGAIEAIIGVYAAFTPWIFEWVQPLYAQAFNSFDRLELNAFRVGLSALVLLVPTALMGGTLPLLARAVARGGEQAARRVGYLYAVNTFGAVAGCLVAGFVLLAGVGIRGSLLIAASLSLAVAVLAILGSRGPATARTALAPSQALKTPIDAAGRFVLVIFFVSGFAALGYEVLWTRALLVYLKASTYAFSLMLSVYLLGIALGSAAVSKLAGRSRQPLIGLALCQVGTAATVVLGMSLFPSLQDIGLLLVGSRQIDSFLRAVALMFAQASLVLLLPTIFMGAMFPFGVAAFHRSTLGVSRSVGSLYAVNTAGNIGGSIVVGFALIPLIGVRHAMVLMVALNLLAAGAVASRLATTPIWRVIGPVLAAALLVVAHFGIEERVFYRSILRNQKARIVFYREGASDTVAVVETDVPQKTRVLIYSDGRGAAGTSSVHWNLYFGHVPMVLHDDPQEILHICYGSGNSVLALTRHDPKRVDVVELSPHVREASEYFWTNEGVIDDPRVNLIIEDGRNYLLGTERTYDVVSLEPPNVYTAGVVNLYTQEFYELVVNHLNPGGIFVQWLPTSQLSRDDRAHLFRAFTEAFPHAYTWQQLIGPTLLLVGTLEPLEVDVDEVEERLRREHMRRDLKTMRVPNATKFLSYFLLGDESTRRVGANHEPVTDDKTIVDFSIPRFIGSGFGFSVYTYAINADGATPKRVSRGFTREYADWADPASEIVPDPEQARQVDEAIRRRQEAGRRIAAMKR